MFEIELNTYKFHIIQYAYLMFIAILAVYQASHFQRDQLGAIEMIKLKTDGIQKVCIGNNPFLCLCDCHCHILFVTSEDLPAGKCHP